MLASCSPGSEGRYLIERVLEDKSIALAVICEFLDLGLDVEGRRFSERGAHDEPILLDVDLGAPRRRHIQRLGQVLQLLLLIRHLNQL